MNTSGYFTIHLPSFSLMHVHWSIDNDYWDDIVSKAVTDIYGDPVLFIRVKKLHGNEWVEVQQIDVFGRDNHWIVSIGGHLHGEVIKVQLITSIERNGEKIIFESEPIALPISPEGYDEISSISQKIHSLNNINLESSDNRLSS